jgi:hypothetical protein
MKRINGRRRGPSPSIWIAGAAVLLLCCGCQWLRPYIPDIPPINPPNTNAPPVVPPVTPPDDPVPAVPTSTAGWQTGAVAVWSGRTLTMTGQTYIVAETWLLNSSGKKLGCDNDVYLNGKHYPRMNGNNSNPAGLYTCEVPTDIALPNPAIYSCAEWTGKRIVWSVGADGKAVRR